MGVSSVLEEGVSTLLDAVDDSGLEEDVSTVDVAVDEDTDAVDIVSIALDVVSTDFLLDLLSSVHSGSLFLVVVASLGVLFLMKPFVAGPTVSGSVRNPRPVPFGVVHSTSSPFTDSGRYPLRGFHAAATIGKISPTQSPE